MDIETKAAIYLEENGINGDAMVDLKEGGAMYIHDIIAGFVAAQQSMQADVKAERGLVDAKKE